ncbi:type III-B CRISPR module RAMP protein Cmr1 [Persephonella sp. KM09-Lau-8]|uniref:type III-B CRISPR module RAMP protein Cmr1 n=1 Tax=Persephonella sp. KM09-Lau-8 TaxID=1158345 RepID=UPI000496326E|nr:type III-B CRISPR module RAMP protein Cmr1 [Persephonella sp. KM09-Lau-8]
MGKITFECEIITPMFMYGGDGKTLELRPSEFKGMLRFWWRALHPELSVEELKEKENEIFGSTERKSSFRIKTKIIKELKGNNLSLRNHNTKGINYLFYSMFLGDNKNKEYFKPGTKFKLTFIFRKEKHIKDILAVFWLLTYLGALGSRSRRGAGSFRITGIQDSQNLISKANLNFLVNEEREFQDNLRKLLPKRQDEKSYINLGNFQLFIHRNSFSSWKEALDDVGKSLQNFRNKREPDYSTVKNFILNGGIGEVKRPAFGLPLMYRYKSLSGKSATLEGSNKERQRSGSPLFIKILQFNNYFKPLLIFFEKELLPKGEKVKISSKNQPKSKFLNVPDLSIVNEFLNQLISENKIEGVNLNDS